MTSIRKIDKIIITYYVNPHHFYFRYKEDPRGDDALSEINKKIEEYVSRHVEKRHPSSYSPQIGEVVLCNYISDCVHKWIRARVDTKLTYDKEMFVLWAIDYGFPIESEARWIRQLLSDDLKVIEKGMIFKGGLFDVVPSTVEWNFIESEEESRKTKKWSSRAVDSVEKYLHEANILTFKCRAYLEDHFFGSLIISNTGTEMYVEDFLKIIKEGVDSPSFLKDFCRLEAQPYWQRQSQDAIYKVYENNSDHSVSKDVTAMWMSTDELLNKNESTFDLLKMDNLKNDEKLAETDETLIKLTDQFDTATKFSSRTGKVSLKNAASNGSSAKVANLFPKRIDTADCTNVDAVISVIPMKNRLAIAQQKIMEQTKITAQKQARNDETNKKLMAMSFPAGFIVDNKAIEDRYKYNRDNQSSTGKKNNFHFNRAKEIEECFSVNHADRILVHCHGNVPVKRIYDIHDADFPQEVHKALKDLNINQVFRMQTIGWPSLLRGSSMIFVNNVRTGKTWTYLPAICSSIIEQFQDGQVIEGCGPLSIIICASSHEVDEITESVEHLLQYTNLGIRCFKAYGFADEANVVSQLLNGREILVTTVPCLYRLLTNELNLFKRERMVSLVFDNIDSVYEQFSREICEIHKTFCDETSDVQMIVTSRTWLQILENFYTKSDRVTLCIGSYIEAAVYARSEMTIELLGQKYKTEKLFSYIKDLNYRQELTIVVCNTPEDVDDLRSISKESWCYHDKSDSSEIREIQKLLEDCKDGKSGGFELLICTDEVLRDLGIRFAQHIVHYSLPPTWTIFAFRFSTLFDHHQNLLDKKSDYKPATSVVFLDENNNDELPRLIDFMKMRSNCDIPEKVLKLAESKRIENEEKEGNYKPFCTDLLTIGVCYGLSTCRHRHIFTKFDRSRDEIPRNGYVKFDIIALRSPAHFTVRLLEHRYESEMEWTKFKSVDEILSFKMEMMKYFEDEKNHIMHLPIALGDLCAICYEAADGKFYERAKIVKFVEKRFMAVTTQYWVDILLIDSNERMSCYSTALLQLPDKLKNFPHQAVDVRIADIVPRDCEWDPSILILVKKWVQNDNRHYLQGFIKLSIMNTLWVDSIDVIEVLRSINEEVKAVSIKRNLLNMNFCVPDTKPLKLLMGLAEKADLIEAQHADRSVFRTPTSIVDRRTGKELQIFHKSDDEDFDLDDSNGSLHNWTASIDDDDDNSEDVRLNENLEKSSASSTQEEDLLRLSKDEWAELTPNQFSKVSLCNFYHPNRIYIRNSCYSSSFLELSQRIDEFTASHENLIPLSDITLAVNCLAKIGDRFGRAKIMKIFHNTEGITAEIFYVDFGEFLILPVNELIVIPNDIVTALPFQAIFGRLIGIRPIDSPKWCDDICDNIYDDLLVKQSHFYAQPVKLGEADKYAYGLKAHSYQMVLVNETGDMNINQWIVSNRFGDFDPETKHFIDVPIDRNILKILNGDDLDGSDCEESNKVSLFGGIGNDDDVSYDIQLDNEDIKELLQANGFTYKDFVDSLPEQIDEINEKDPSKPAVVAEVNGTNSSVTKSSSVVDKLVSLHKFPKIKWHQTESVIVLTVHAPDVLDYFLKITSRMVKICFIQDQENFAGLLNLYGCVDVQHSSHEIRGLNIVIRLVKALGRSMWPRLVQATIKNHLLQYNFEAVDGSEEFVPEWTSTSAGFRQNDTESSSNEDDGVDDDLDFDL